ncbi:MAG: transposase [Planctomycetia bacterium]|nr:transposase [Planctomycetia bacterium]
MPQSLSAVHVHLIFSTKGRRPLLHDVALREALHAYLGGISRELDCPPVRIGGVADHVHILARLGRTISQADWVKEIKRVSTLWLKGHTGNLADFQWQAGYACFSVSQSNISRVADYIAQQEEHHRHTTYQNELLAFFEKHQIEFDKRYVWD